MTITEWQWTMKKPQVLLPQGLHALALPLMQKYWGFKSYLPIKIINGDIYFGKKEIKSIQEEIKQKIYANQNYPDEIEKIIHKKINNLKKIISFLKKQNPKELADEKLILYFMKGYTAIAEITAFMSFKGTVEMSDILEEKIQEILKEKTKDAEERNNIFLILSLPVEESFMMQEQKSVLQIAAAAQEGNEIKQLLNEHVEKFKWMGCVMYTGEPYDEEHFKKEIEEAMEMNCQQTLRKQEEKNEKKEKNIEIILDKLQFTKEEKELLQQFRTWAHLRTYVKDMTSLGMVPTLPFLEEIAKRIGWAKKDLLYLSHTELMSIFKGKRNLLLKESKERQKGWGFVLIKDRVEYYNDKTLKEIEEREESIPKGIKGFSACNGIVEGKAIVVKTIDDLARVKKGDILITHMTTTNFVPVLSRVAAIVTDEGGITCHAAIISREMNIPCIIGTRFATKAFKDGDIVEVDANKGIVRKIK